MICNNNRFIALAIDAKFDISNSKKCKFRRVDWEGKVVQLHEKLLRRRRKLRLARRLAAKTSRDILTATEATVLIH